MKYAEIKEKMTQGEWEIQQLNHIDGDLWLQVGYKDPYDKHSWGPVVEIKYHVWPEATQWANAHAITTAVNNTYGKGIDPEAVEGLIKALERLVSVTDPQINRYASKASVGLEPFFKEPVAEARRILARAKAKGAAQ